MPYQALIAEQYRDDHQTHLRRSRRQVRATDLGPQNEGWLVLATTEANGLEPWEIVSNQLEPWQAAAIRDGFGGDIPNATILIGFTPTWNESIIHFDPTSGQACPCCGSVPGASKLKPHEYCACCSGTRRRPKQFPMQTAAAVATTMRWPLRNRVRRILDGGTGRLPSRPEIRPRPIEPRSPEEN